MKFSLFIPMTLVCAIYLVSGVSVSAQLKEKSSLRGIKELRVLVANVSPELEGAGLKTAVIQTEVELKLRQNGLLVKSRESDAKIPMLYVRLMSVPDDGAFALSVDVSLIQRVILERDTSNVVRANTWNTGRTGKSGELKVTGIRTWISEMIDEFLNDLLEMNPKARLQ